MKSAKLIDGIVNAGSVIAVIGAASNVEGTFGRVGALAMLVVASVMYRWAQLHVGEMQIARSLKWWLGGIVVSITVLWAFDILQSQMAAICMVGLLALNLAHGIAVASGMIERVKTSLVGEKSDISRTEND